MEILSDNNYQPLCADSTNGEQYVCSGEEWAEQVHLHKMALLDGTLKPSDIALVRPEIALSWLRSANAGLLVDEPLHPIKMDEEQFQRRLKEKEPLLKVAEFYIKQLSEMFYESKSLACLTDENGLILRISAEESDLIFRQNMHAPGYIWTEETVGTCAHVLCVQLRCAVQMSGAESYSSALYPYICSVAPIFDAEGNLIGTLSVDSQHSETQNPHSLGMVAAMAWAIQNELAHQNEAQTIIRTTFESAKEAILTTDQQGMITDCNQAAKELFGSDNSDLLGQNIAAFVPDNLIAKRVLRDNGSLYDMAVNTADPGRRLYVNYASPFKAADKHAAGFVFNLQPLKKANAPTLPSVGNEARYHFSDITGESPRLLETKEKARIFATLRLNVLLQGESGTGKEMFAQAMHNLSAPNKPFVAINCSAIPKTLFESELFGYEAGSFTGADRNGHPGKIEMAQGGTLFLDEIGDMPSELQVALLRVLEEKRVTRIGGHKSIPVDFRLIAATNQNLHTLVQEKQFRSDLYYRLAVLVVNIPPLRERGSDLPLLLNTFCQLAAQELQMPTPVFSAEAMCCLSRFQWPGNVRQMENSIMYAAATCKNGVIELSNLPDDILCDIPAHSGDSENKEQESTDNKFTMKQMESTLIGQTLRQTDGNVYKAAELLGMSRTTLYKKIKLYNITLK